MSCLNVTFRKGEWIADREFMKTGTRIPDLLTCLLVINLKENCLVYKMNDGISNKKHVIKCIFKPCD